MWWHLISMACILLCTSAVGVHDSQAYREMDVTRERISRILDMIEMLLSFQTGFNLVNAAVVCAILESTSGLEPRQIHLSQVLEACDCLKLLTVYFDLLADAAGVVCHQLGLLGTMEDLWNADLIFPVLLPLLLSQQYHQESADR